jgi:hypothetical protein
MCNINFVREFGLIMEEARKEYMGCRERMLWISLFYIANDRAQYNPQTQTYDWPEDFFQISHAELNLYCKLDKKAIEQLRNYLKQKGYIEFQNGERNGKKPAYKLNYLSKRDFGGENAPKETPNIPPKDTPKAPPKDTPNTGPKDTPLYSKYKQGIDTGEGDTHTADNDREAYTRPRAGSYLGLDFGEYPCRFDSAWQTSERARGAVAQRILDGACWAGDGYAHERVTEYMQSGLPPELIEDAAKESKTYLRFLTTLDIAARDRGLALA